MSRRRKIVAFALLFGLAIATAIGLRCRTTPVRHGYVDTYHALADGTAVVVWRESDGRHGYVSVVRVAANGSILWRRAIHAYAVGFSLTVGENTIVVRNHWDVCPTTSGPCDKVIALAQDSGRVLWTRNPTVRAGMAIRSDVPLARIVGGLYIDGLAVHRAGYEWNHSLFAIDLRTGELAWELPLPELVGPPVLVGDRLLLHDDMKAVVAIDVKTGRARRFELDGEAGIGLGCVVGGSYFTITGRHTNPRLTAFRGGDLEVTSALRPIPRLPRRPSFSRAAACASFGKDLVFTMTTYANPAPSMTVVALVIGPDGRDGRLIEIAEGTISPSDIRSFEGDLPKYTPVHWHTSEENRFILLDLEQARVVSRGSVEDVGLLEMFHVQKQWYLQWHSHRRGYTVAVMDGDTGVLRAINVDVTPELRGFSRQHVASGKLWLFDGGWAPRVRIEEMSVAVLDAATLTPTFVRGVRIKNATDVAREQLGLDAKAP